MNGVGIPMATCGITVVVLGTKEPTSAVKLIAVATIELRTSVGT